MFCMFMVQDVERGSWMLASLIRRALRILFDLSSRRSQLICGMSSIRRSFQVFIPSTSSSLANRSTPVPFLSVSPLVGNYSVSRRLAIIIDFNRFVFLSIPHCPAVFCIHSFILFINIKKLTSLKLIVRTMWWYHSTKTAKIFWVTLDGATHGASISCPMHS